MQIPGFAPIAKGSFGLVMPATGKGHGQGPGVPRSGPEPRPGGPRTRATDKGHEFLDQAPDEGHEFLDQAPEEGHGRRGRHGGGPRSSAAEGHGRRRISHKGHAPSRTRTPQKWDKGYTQTREDNAEIDPRCTNLGASKMQQRRGGSTPKCRSRRRGDEKIAMS